MPPRPPKDPATVGSFAELRSHYKVLYGMLEDCHKMKGMTNEALRYRTGEVRGAKEEAKKAKRQVVTARKEQRKVVCGLCFRGRNDIDHLLPDRRSQRWFRQVAVVV